MARGGAVALLILALVSGRLAAQEATGRVEGLVVLVAGRPATAVRVTVSSTSLQGRRSGESDARGHFRLADLPVGTYQVRLALIGYRPVLIDQVEVGLGRTTSLGPITLDPQALELGEIVVSARPALLDLTSAAAVTNIPAEQFRTLPTDRNFRSIITLAPEAVHTGLPGDEANISGSTGPENAYYLDGVNITDPQTAETSADLPFNFIKEIEVKEGGYEAEYGRATGGIINLITYSGGNRFGGELFGFYTNDQLTAEPRFSSPRAGEPGFTTYDVGGSLGGPIVRDRLWFFAAYDPGSYRQGAEVSGRLLPDSRSREHLFASKLTWQAGARTDVMLAVHGDPQVTHVTNVALAAAVSDLVNPDPILSVEHHGGLVASGLVRHRFGGSVKAELSASRFTRRNRFDAATELGRTAPLFIDYTSWSLSGGLGQSQHVSSVRTAVGAGLSMAHGPHAIKVGLEYEDNQLHDDWDLSAEPGSPGGIIQRLDISTYKWQRLHARSTVHNRVPSAYAQDAWRVTSRLTLQAGVRWDGQYFIGNNGKVVQSFPREWQPRLGLSLGLGRPGSQKLYGSFGRFYEQVPLSLVTGYYNPQPLHVRTYDHDPRIDPSGGHADIDSLFGPTKAEPRHDMKGQSLDEVRVGYERALGPRIRAGIRGVYRRLRWAVEDATDSTHVYHLGNPGRGNLAFLPRARRSYEALVLTLEQPAGGRFDFLASYVLSRSYGNYAGLYDYAENGAGPNQSQQFDFPGMVRNNTGLVPNDRTHVLKFSGTYRSSFGLTVGTDCAWMSGMPRYVLIGLPVGLPGFFQSRGSAGRNPALLDANLRFTYRPPGWNSTRLRPMLFFDLFEIGNRRTALVRNDVRYIGLDDNGNVIANPSYATVFESQPPMSARLGMSVDFGAEP